MEKLIKNALGQWKLVGEMLRKSPEDAPKPIQPTINSDIRANSKKLSKLFSDQNEHIANGRAREAHEVKGQIKDLALRAPKGSIDVGHLGSMRDTQLKVKHPDSPEFQRGSRPLGKKDMEEIINHHLGDAKSLKDIHQNHGGMKTIEAVLKTVGSAADPTHYSNMKFKNPNVYLDMIDLLNPGKSQFEREEEGNRAKGILPKSPYSKTPANPDLHKKVEQTWDTWMNRGQDSEEDHGNQAAHEKSVMDRATDIFKRHHKLT